MRRKRTEITIEFEEVVHAANHRHPFASVSCLACGHDAPMVSPEQAAAITQTTVRSVNQRVEAGSVHFLETADGRLWVCLKSLD